MDYVHRIRQYLGPQPIILNTAGTLIFHHGKLLLQRRADNGKWGLIGGLLEFEETYEEAALREAKEETGLNVELASFLGIFHNHHMRWANGDEAHVIGAYYVAKIVSGELRVDEESLELRYFALDELPPLFAEDHIAAIEAYKRGISLPLPKENRLKP